MKIEDKRTSRGMERHVLFDSFGEVLSKMYDEGAAPVDPVNVARFAEYRRDAESAPQSFFNYKTLPMLMREIDAPPDRLIDKVMEMKEKVRRYLGEQLDTQTVGRIRRKIRRKQDSGDDLDPLAWIQRNPDGWSRQERVTRPHQVIKIGVNLAVHARANASWLTARGGAVVALADALTDHGYSVEITGFDVTYGASRQTHCLIVEVPAKRAFNPMDIGQVAICLAELAYYRIVVLQTIIGTTVGAVSTGLGRPGVLPHGFVSGCDVLIEAGVKTEADAMTAVKNAIAKITSGK